jgi:DNA-binding transcriptional LysR family regulator
MQRDLDLNDIRAFVAVVDAESFSGAARALGSPKSTVSRRVSRLERALSVTLLHRTTRTLALTTAGKQYAERARLALSMLQTAGAATTAQQERAAGLVRVTAPTDVGSEVLPQLLADFTLAHPDVSVEVELSSRAPDLIAGAYDVAIGAGQQRDSSLIQRKLQDMPFKLYASPLLEKRLGLPRSARQLSAYPCVLFRPVHHACRWRLHDGRRDIEIEVRGPVAGDDIAFVRRAAVAGAGITLLPQLVGDHLCESGELTSVLPKMWARGPALYLLTLPGARMPLRVRLFCDFLVHHFPAPASPTEVDVRRYIRRRS